MKFRDFQLPIKIKWLTEKDDYGKLSCEPFERGYGHTLGNSIRRVLLASMEGAVITSVKIEGVQHEYSTVEGVTEDILEIIFNLKQLRFKVHTEENQTIKLEVRGPKKVTAADLILNESTELFNPEAHIATLGENSVLSFEATVSRGRGYSAASSRQDDITSIGVIPMDAAFSPIRKVNYDVENARLGQKTDFDKLIIEIWTDGSVKPSESIAYASSILKQSLEVFDIPEIEEVELGEVIGDEEVEEDLLGISVEELDIGTRVTNSLLQTGVNNLGELLEKTESEILKIEKVGKKSIDDIRAKLDEINSEKGTNFKLREE